jgi:hypothetical protein
MKLTIIIVTKNSSVAVRTLHNLLNINGIAFITENTTVEITYVKDDPFEKAATLTRKIKTSDRVLFIEYGVSMDLNSIKEVFKPLENNADCIVFPCVKPGINWDMFKTKVMSDSKESLNQMGLDFDTEVSTKISEKYYKVTNTVPKCWLFNSKSVVKCMKEKKGEGLKFPPKTEELFAKLIDRSNKVYAFVDANIHITYQHECLSNILNSAGINKD